MNQKEPSILLTIKDGDIFRWEEQIKPEILEKWGDLGNAIFDGKDKLFKPFPTNNPLHKELNKLVAQQAMAYEANKPKAVGHLLSLMSEPSKERVHRDIRSGQAKINDPITLYKIIVENHKPTGAKLNAARIEQHNKIISMKMSETDDIEEYSTKYRQQLRICKMVGATQEEGITAYQYLMSLPASYQKWKHEVYSSKEGETELSTEDIIQKTITWGKTEAIFMENQKTTEIESKQIGFVKTTNNNRKRKVVVSPGQCRHCAHKARNPESYKTHDTKDCWTLKREEYKKKKREEQQKDSDKNEGEEINLIHSEIVLMTKTNNATTTGKIIFDTGATINIMRSTQDVHDIRIVDTPITTIDGTKTRKVKQGEHQRFGKSLIMEESQFTLLSPKCIMDKGVYRMTWSGDNKTFTLTNRSDPSDEISLGLDASGHYTSTVFTVSEYPTTYSDKTTDHEENNELKSTADRKRAEKLRLLHNTLGHPYDGYLKEMLKYGAFQDWNLQPQDVDNCNTILGPCEPCILGKSKWHEKTHPIHQPSSPGEHLHADIIFIQSTNYKKQEYLAVMDEASSKPFLYRLKSKEPKEIIQGLHEIINWFGKYNKKVKDINIDHEATLVSKELNDAMNEIAIDIRPMPPGIHEKFAERFVQHLKNRMRAVIHSLDYTLPNLWYHYLATDTIITMGRTSNNKTAGIPINEFITNIQESDSYLGPPFGTVALFRIPKEQIKSDTQPRTEYGVVLGRQINTRNLTVYSLATNNIVTRNEPIQIKMNERIQEHINQIANSQQIPKLDTMIGYKAASLKPPHLLTPYDKNIPDKTVTLTAIEMNKEAEMEEIKQLIEREVFERVTIRSLTEEERKRIISSKLFTVPKYDSAGNLTKYKSRLVAGGHKQIIYYDVSTQPVRIDSVIIILNIAITMKYDIQAMDIGGAYLNAKLSKPEFIWLEGAGARILEQIKGYKTTDGKILLKLKRALYGLKQSGMLWKQLLQKTMEQYGLKTSQHDSGIMYSKDLIIAIHVDDILMVGDKNKITSLIDYTRNKFKKLTLQNGQEISYLGILIEKYEHYITLSQPGFANEIIQEVNEHIETSDVPCNPDLFEEDENSPRLHHKKADLYRSQLMKAMYLTRSRPDLKLTIGYLCTIVNNPTEQAWQKLKKLQGYIKATMDLKMYIKPSTLQLFVSVDASYAPHKDGKSQSGIMISMGNENSPVHASSTKQKLVTKSSTEAELIALNQGGEETEWARNMLNELGYEQSTTEIQQDNKSCIQIANRGPGRIGKTKHIKVRYFWIHEKILDKSLQLSYIPSNELVADGFTKPLTKAPFIKWRKRILNSDNLNTSEYYPNSTEAPTKKTKLQ
jgi:hypothetical protein